jgi:hypothetical protein
MDYDLSKDQPGRRQFFRFLHKILDSTKWRKSSDSIIVVDDYSKVQLILHLIKAFIPVNAHVYKKVLLE